MKIYEVNEESTADTYEKGKDETIWTKNHVIVHNGDSALIPIHTKRVISIVVITMKRYDMQNNMQRKKLNVSW